MIPVTKPYLPNRDRLNQYFDRIYETNFITNNGPLLQELTYKLEQYLGVKNLLLVANGTLALQIAYKAVGINKAAITPAFSFAASPSSLDWNGVEPIFCDIEKDSFCIDINSLVKTYTKNISRVEIDGIVPVHVYGNGCDVENIDKFAKDFHLKLVYDASHAFMTQYKCNKLENPKNYESLLKFGDASTLSFHATKLFHCVEGGAIIFNKDEDYENAKKMINFGIDINDYKIKSAGINAKMSEFHAAMGLSILEEIDLILKLREEIWYHYQKELSDSVVFHKTHDNFTRNYSYAPILLKDEKQLLLVKNALENEGILSRRYFSPPLNKLEFLQDKYGIKYQCPVAEDISSRILCLPMYPSLSINNVNKICKIVKRAVIQKNY